MYHRIIPIVLALMLGAAPVCSKSAQALKPNENDTAVVAENQTAGQIDEDTPVIHGTLTATQIVAACDAVRNPDRPFRFTETLVEYRGNSPIQKVELTIFAKEDESGRFNSLVRFEKPLRDRDKIMMKNGNDLWYFDPKSKASVRISPQQRLMGQASNGDVVSVNMARDYDADLSGEVTIQDADRKNRDCHLVKLSAREDSVTYRKIDLWVEKDTFIPVKGKFYSDSGRLLKIAYYRRLVNELGRNRPTETIIIDGLDRTRVTKMTNADYQYAKIPDFWFQKAYLPRFSAE
jgi:outer membrane lipoprotein-sorting protein